MATEFIGIPDQLMTKLRQAAEREEITLEELVRDALEQRVLSTQFSHLFATGDRNVKRTGAQPQDVEPEIAAHRSKPAVDDTCHSGHQRDCGGFELSGQPTAHSGVGGSGAVRLALPRPFWRR